MRRTLLGLNMTRTTDPMAQQQEIEALLPWHAAGTLSRRDARRVEEALAQDPELARRFALIRDELSETILLNETLGAPSGRAMDRLLASIEAEDAPARRRSRGGLKAFAAFMSERVARISPRTLGWSASAAGLVIALQAGLLTGLYVQERSGAGTYNTASFDDGAESSRGIETSRGVGATRGIAGPGGSYALIRFDPKAGMAEVSKFLESHGASVVDGPRAGMYRIRLADTALPEDEVARILKAMQDDTRIVRFVGTAN
jgi:hypothetical protein